MKRKIISCLLTISMLFSIIAPCAAYSIQEPQMESDTTVVGLSDIIPAITAEEAEVLCEELAPQVYESLNDEAKLIFDQCLASNPELLQYHRAQVDPNYTPSGYTLYNNNSITAALSVSIAALALPAAVEYALNAMGSALVVELASGAVLPVGKILIAAATVKIVAACALYWTVVSPKWSQIVRAFTSAFVTSVNNFISAFTQLQQDSTLEYYRTTYPVSVSQQNMTITVGKTRFTCSTQAETAERTLRQNGGKYFPAMLLSRTTPVLVSLTPVNEEVAATILSQNMSLIGTMAITDADARSVCVNRLGGIARAAENSGPNQIGFWKHYHPKFAAKAHSWFLSKAA